jgi:hypothetical protein
VPWRRTAENDDSGLSDMAYRLTSDVPVSAYQFNPLQYRLDRECTGDAPDQNPADMACYSYTNDASLLLPTTALGTSYIVVAPSMVTGTQALTDPEGKDVLEDDAGVPYEAEYAMESSATIVATKDTTVTISTTVDVVTEKGRAQAGEEIVLDLKAGQASQMHFLPPDSFEACPGRTDERMEDCTGELRGLCMERRTFCEGADPSGTRIRADQPVAVYVGSPCSYVPYNRTACDHLEEMLPPLSTWGREVVVGITQPLTDEPNIVRIVSAVDGNKLQFEPSDIHDQVTLDEGDVLEIDSRVSFRVKGSQPLLVAQYLVGQQYVDPDEAEMPLSQERRAGDPSLTFATPVEQYRRDFDFLTPSTYDSGFVTVVAPDDADVIVDDQYVASWEAIGETGYKVGHHQLKPSARTRATCSLLG